MYLRELNSYIQWLNLKIKKKHLFLLIKIIFEISLGMLKMPGYTDNIMEEKPY